MSPYWLSSPDKPGPIWSLSEALWRVKVPWRRRRRSEVWLTSHSEWVPYSWGLKMISAFTPILSRTEAWCFIPQINNLWKSSVKASLHIHWPKWNKDGKWLLYLVRISSTGPQEILCSPLSEVNSLKLQQVMFFLSFLFSLFYNREKSTTPDCSM